MNVWWAVPTLLLLVGSAHPTPVGGQCLLLLVGSAHPTPRVSGKIEMVRREREEIV